MATGFFYIRPEIEHNNFAYFNSILPQLRDIRRYGSADIDLCYVSCVKLDGFWEMNLNVYDVSAAVLIVKEVGSHVFDFKRAAYIRKKVSLQ
jgi:myo-inositol-1(or 4)-monophosphatase